MSSILFLQGCAPSRITRIKKMEIAAVPSIEQKIGYEETVTSQKKHFVSLAPYSELNVGNRTIFMMSVQNGGEEPINMSYDNISVIFEDRKGAPININIQSTDNFINNFKMESRLIELNFLRSVLGSFKSYLGALLEESSRLYSVTNYGMEEDIDRSFVSPFDAEEKMKEFEMMRSQNQQIIEALPDFAITPQKIMPGDSYAGVVVCDTRQMNPTIEGNFEITVSVDGEEHKFTFRRAINK